MASLVSIYTNAVYENLRPLRANWEPTQPLVLGDYGILDGQVLQRLGNVADLGLVIGASIDDDVGDQKIFSSAADTTVQFNAGGKSASNPAITINASVEITFASKDSAFFNAAGCSYSIIKDKSALEVQVMAALRAGTWQRQWAVVTDLVKARSTTIAVSGSSSGSLVLEATGSVSRLDLADANIGLTLKTAKNLGYQVISQKNLVPLVAISQVQSKFLWWGDQFKPLSADMLSDRRRMFNLQNSPAVITEPDTDLYFGQLL